MNPAKKSGLATMKVRSPCKPGAPTYQNLLPKGVPFEHAVSMRPGMASLSLLVVDENSGRMGSVTVPALAMETGH